MGEHLKTCPTCGGEGRDIRSHQPRHGDPSPDPEIDCGECRACDGKREIRVTTWTNPGAPPMFYWGATFGDYDLGAPIGEGATEDAAIADLMENYA